MVPPNIDDPWDTVTLSFDGHPDTDLESENRDPGPPAEKSVPPAPDNYPHIYDTGSHL